MSVELLYGENTPLLVSLEQNWSTLYIFASCLMDILTLLFRLYQIYLKWIHKSEI